MMCVNKVLLNQVRSRSDPSVVSWCRRLVDCAMCEGVEEIDIVDAEEFDKEKFLERYVGFILKKIS